MRASSVVLASGVRAAIPPALRRNAKTRCSIKLPVVGAALGPLRSALLEQQQLRPSTTTRRRAETSCVSLFCASLHFLCRLREPLLLPIFGPTTASMCFYLNSLDIIHKKAVNFIVTTRTNSETLIESHVTKQRDAASQPKAEIRVCVWCWLAGYNRDVRRRRRRCHSDWSADK